MRVRRSGIALILVLVAAASVFALAMQAAVSSRLGAVETASSLREHEGELRARGAASIVFAALLRTASEEAPGDAAAAGDLSRKSPSPAAPDDLELPAFLRKMLEESGTDLHRAAADAVATQSTQQALDGGGLGATAPRSIDLSEAIALTLPTQPIDVKVDSWHCRVMLADGAGGLNINTTDEASLLRYVAALNVASPTDRAIVSQMLDWRDEDDFVHERGAERDAYDRLGIALRNGPMRTLAELRYLPDMTPALLERMESDLCLSSDGRAHLGSASPAVLEASGVLSDEQIRQIVALRSQGALTSEAISDIVDMDDEEVAARVRPASSPVIRVRVEAYPPDVRPGDSQLALHFEGAAVVGERGLRELGLRARSARLPEAKEPTMARGGHER